MSAQWRPAFPQVCKTSRTPAVINDELKRLNVDIATLQETRLADSGTLKEKDYTFWQGKRSNEPREHGVGFAVRNSLLRMVEPGSGGSERLPTLRLNSTTGPVTLISVYTPTLSATPDTKKTCSTRTLHLSSGTFPARNKLFWVTSMPEWVQITTRGPPALVSLDWAKWMKIQPLLELCIFHDLCITNSFRTKPQHKVPWRHPCSKHWHQLDLILGRHAAIKNFLHTRSYYRADCDTDHSLVCCKIRMQPKKFHHTKTKGIPRTAVSKMSQPDLTEQFAQTFQKEFGSLQPGDSATEKWEALHDTMYHTALATFGKRASKSHDWFKAKSTVMTLAEYKCTPSERNLQDFQVQGSADCSALHKQIPDRTQWEHPVCRCNGEH